MRNDTEVKLQGLFEEVFKAGREVEYSEYSIESSDLWDSLAMIEIILKIEKTFNIAVPSNDLEKFSSFKSIYMYLSDYKK